jgi:hypothetical protein
MKGKDMLKRQIQSSICIIQRSALQSVPFRFRSLHIAQRFNGRYDQKLMLGVKT